MTVHLRFCLAQNQEWPLCYFICSFFKANFQKHHTSGLKALGFGSAVVKPPGVNTLCKRHLLHKCNGISPCSHCHPTPFLPSYRLPSLEMLHEVTLPSSFSACYSPVSYPIFPTLRRPPTHPFHWSAPSSPSWLPLSSPVFLPFHLRVLPPPDCLHSFCPTEQGQIQSLPHSHFSHSFCQFWLPAFYPIPYSHCFPSLLFCTCELQMGGEEWEVEVAARNLVSY